MKMKLKFSIFMSTLKTIQINLNLRTKCNFYSFLNNSKLYARFLYQN